MRLLLAATHTKRMPIFAKLSLALVCTHKTRRRRRRRGVRRSKAPNFRRRKSMTMFASRRNALNECSSRHTHTSRKKNSVFGLNNFRFAQRARALHKTYNFNHRNRTRARAAHFAASRNDCKIERTFRPSLAHRLGCASLHTHTHTHSYTHHFRD